MTKTITNDGLGQVTLRHVDANNEPEANTYDAAGNKTSPCGKQAGTTTTSTYTLNPLDQTLVEARSDGSTTRTNFDPAGNPTDWTINGGLRVRAAYDAEGQLCDVESGAAPETPSCTGCNVIYDEAGRMTQFPVMEGSCRLWRARG